MKLSLPREVIFSTQNLTLHEAIFRRGLGGVVVIDAAIGAHGRGSRPVHYLTVAATLDKSLTSHCL